MQDGTIKLMVLVYFVLLCSTAISAIAGWRIVRALKRYEYIPAKDAASSTPTVSVCIAARNEVHALAQCLDYVLTNTYEKLEVLVLDDSSGDETSRIIKSYAHAGVRFVPGRDLPQGWLGKNHAYQTLAMEASGDYVLYLGVDTLLGSTSIEQLVRQITAKQKSMLSVLPRREDGMHSSAIFGTVRYMWELVFSSPLSPPCSGAIWLIDRKRLLQLDRGLEDYGMSVRPENHIARQLQRNKEYYYLIGTEALGVRYEKHLVSQFASAERLYYPLVGHSVVSAIGGLLALFLLVAPYVAFVWLLATEQYQLCIAAIVVGVLGYGSFMAFSLDTYHKRGLHLRALVWPYLLVQETLLLLHSTIRYLSHTVRWKGRSVHARPANRQRLVIDE
ncbi:glycosyltransferase family 2 protein [Candidatus Saccharibacteria bacterium]|nr:glycosyltransferase family 2 protein [Candidatus Saccharibacteria bacterium]